VNGPQWLLESDVQLLHEELIRKYGGMSGLRDPGLLSGSLAKPKNLFAYTGANLYELAAAYGYGLAKNHCFIDGNKRVAFAAATVFLRLNGFELVTSPAEAVVMMLRVASSNTTQEDLAKWIAENTQSKPFL
jgi:death on curing protein